MSDVVVPTNVSRSASVIDFYHDLLGTPDFETAEDEGTTSSTSERRSHATGASSKSVETSPRRRTSSQQRFEEAPDISFICADFADRASLLDAKAAKKFHAFGGTEILCETLKRYRGVEAECAVFSLAHLSSISDRKTASEISKCMRQPTCVEAMNRFCERQNLDIVDEGSVRSALVALTHAYRTSFDESNADTLASLAASHVTDFVHLLCKDAEDDKSVSGGLRFDESLPMLGAVLDLLSVVSKFDCVTESMFKEGIFDIAIHLSNTFFDQYLLECCAVILGNMLNSKSSVRTSSETIGAKAEVAYGRLTELLGEDSTACANLRTHIDRLEKAKDAYRRHLSSTGHTVTQHRVLILHTHTRKSSANPPGLVRLRGSFGMASAMRQALGWLDSEAYIQHTRSIIETSSTFDAGLTAQSARDKLRSFFNYRDESLIIVQCSVPVEARTGAWVFAKGATIRFVEIMRMWINSSAKRGGAVLLILAEGDNSGALVDQAKRTKVSQLVIHSSCDDREESMGGRFFDCFSTLQREGDAVMSRVVANLERCGMHPQLYASEDVCKRNLAQTKVQAIRDDSGYVVLMTNLLRGCVIRFIQAIKD